MFDDTPMEFALRGERGIDLFLRTEDTGEKRARFRCIATLRDDGTLDDFEPQHRRDTEHLSSLARKAVADEGLGAPLSLIDPASWPRAAAAPDPLRLFLYHEVFRAWQVADMAAQRFLARLRGAPGQAPMQSSQLSGSIAPLHAFNRLSLGVEVATILQPVLKQRIATPGWREEQAGATGYALRMLGDLCTRAGDHALALACHETAVLSGDNTYRRRKAIEAAHALGDTAARDAHIAAFRDRWPLPRDLAALQQTETP